MLSKLRVRTKLVAVVVVPLLALAVLTGVYVKDRFERRQSALTDLSITRSVRSLAAANTEIGSERMLAVAVMGGESEALSGELDAQRARTDQAIAESLRMLNDLDVAGMEPALSKDAAAFTKAAASLAATRAEINDPKSSLIEVASGYVALTDSIDDLVGDLSRSAKGDVALSDLAIFVTSNSTESGEVAYVAVQLGSNKRVGTDDRMTAETKASDLGSLSRALRSTFQSNLATEDDRKVLKKFYEDPRYAASTAVFSKIADGQPPADYDLTLSEFVSLASDRLNVVAEAEQQLISRAEQLAVSSSDSANKWTRALVALALAGFIAAAVFATFVGRSISRPLIRLARAARLMNEETLPALVDSMARPDIEPPSFAPIDLKTEDELGDLAGALNELQNTALEVAHRQGDLLKRGISDIFVNLARRNQSLLDRQIEFIDRLESTEEDPDRLDQLFRLDHLATRMRRNAESLLVLAGAEQTRRRTRDVSLRDVIRVAIGEVDDYQRIHIASLDDVMVTGAAAVDLAHLISELMENGTQYSPPETPVEVVGHNAQGGTYAVTISDHGVGMTDVQLGQANSALARPPAVALNVGRALGFVVVSALAARHRITVRVSKGVPNGTVAAISLPVGSFRPNTTTDASAPSAQPPRPRATERVMDSRPASTPQVAAYSQFVGTDHVSQSMRHDIHEARPDHYGDPSWHPGGEIADAPTELDRRDAAAAQQHGSTEQPRLSPPGFQHDPLQLGVESFRRPDDGFAADDFGSRAEPGFSGNPGNVGSGLAPAAFGEPFPMTELGASASDDGRVAQHEFSTDGFVTQGFTTDGFDQSGFATTDDPAFGPAGAVGPISPDWLDGDRASMPQQLDDAIPLGRAFEMGIYSLLQPDQDHPHLDQANSGFPAVGRGPDDDSSTGWPQAGHQQAFRDLGPLGELPPSHRTQDADRSGIEAAQLSSDMMKAFAMDALPSGEDLAAKRQLPKRDAIVGNPIVPQAEQPPVAASSRSPEEVWSMLNRYRSARQRGRGGAASAGDQPSHEPNDLMSSHPEQDR